MARAAVIADNPDLAGNDFRELTQRQQSEIDTDPRVSGPKQAQLEARAARGDVLALNQLQDAAERQEAEFGAGGARSIDTQLATKSISGGDARAAYDALEQQLALQSRGRYNTGEAQKRIESIPEQDRTPNEQARDDYFKNVVETSLVGQGQLDFKRYQANLVEWQKRWPDLSKGDVSPSRHLSPKHEELQRDRQTLRPYFENEEALWERIAPTLPPSLVGNARDLDEFREILIKRATDKGATRNKAELDAEKLWSVSLTNGLSLADMEQTWRAAFLGQHQNLVPLLLKWNYNGWRQPPKYLIEMIEKAGTQ